MSRSLLEHYEEELFFIRRLAQDFAKKYPAAAARLRLEEDRSQDPHVERLIEAFALLAGRVQHKIHDEFPELTDAMLQVLYPHYVAPIPSLALVQMDLDRQLGATMPDGCKVPAGSGLHTQAVGNVSLKYRTCYPLHLWPVALTDARLMPPPFPFGVMPPPRTDAALRLRIESPDALPFAMMSLDRLRFHLHADPAQSAVLYDLLFNHVSQILVRPVDPKQSSASFYLDPKDAITPVGFGEDEYLLPYPRRSFPGYRLLSEYFAFPFKFLFFDLNGLKRIRKPEFGRAVEVVFFLNRTNTRLEQSLDASYLRLGCTPVVNLFEHTCEPIAVTQTRHSYHVVPSVQLSQGYEIHTVTSVTGARSAGGDREYRPFYSFRHGEDRDSVRAFWYPTRRASYVENDRGSEIDLQLVDLDFDPATAADSVLVVRTLCTNRDLPRRLPRSSPEVQFEREFAAPLQRVRCLRSPTPSLRPPLKRGLFWRLISHLNLNHFSLSDPHESLPALQEILRLYDFADPDADTQISSLPRQVIDGVVGLSGRRVVGRSEGSFCRGVEVTVELDEEKFVGTSMLLFATVLERFFGLYVTVNSFSKLVARVRQGDRELKRWPARAGDQVLL